MQTHPRWDGCPEAGPGCSPMLLWLPRGRPCLLTHVGTVAQRQAPPAHPRWGGCPEAGSPAHTHLWVVIHGRAPMPRMQRQRGVLPDDLRAAGGDGVAPAKCGRVGREWRVLLMPWGHARPCVHTAP
eukprot:364172-Chlamydomonas_euryale.AAC.3